MTIKNRLEYKYQAKYKPKMGFIIFYSATRVYLILKNR